MACSTAASCRSISPNPENASFIDNIDTGLDLV